MLLKYVPSKKSLSTPWKLELRRDELCASVISHFGDKFTKSKLFQPTDVTFFDAHGESCHISGDSGIRGARFRRRGFRPYPWWRQCL